jgi:zinc transport system ATP-binding protein
MVVSHDVGVVAQHVDQIACLNRRLVAHGLPAEVLRPEGLSCMYGRAAVLVDHGDLPHIVLRRHEAGED